MFRAWRFILLVLAVAPPLAGETVLDDLEKAKRQFLQADYQASLSTLDGIEQNLRVLEAAQTRANLAPALTFYRAADYAMLGAREDAVTTFAEFLKLAPETTIDRAAYPKPVLAAFLEAGKRSAPTPERLIGRESGIEAAYAAFATPVPVEETDPHGDFTRGPLAGFMTSEERSSWDLAISPEDRARWILGFWERRNPAPESGKNSLREELDKRIAFADTRFTQGETRGSMTDRGEVLVLLGPPSYIGRKPLSGAEDPSVRQQANDISPLPLGATPGMVAEHNRAVDTNSTFNFGAQRDFRETWHYRTLPSGLPARSLDLSFVTKQGGGTGQLSRNPDVLRVLEAARRNLRFPGQP